MKTLLISEATHALLACLKRIHYYFNIWLMMNKSSFMVYLNNKTILGIFLLGKILRFTFFSAFLFFLVSGANDLAGYSVNQTIFFFLTFNIVDVISQFLFREVYRFRTYVVSGDFDLILLKPISPLFRVLMGGADIIDLITLPPLIFAVYYIGRGVTAGGWETFLYIALLLNGLLVATAFHILVLSMGIITLEVDHSVMIFRDLTKLGTLPIDVYREPLRSLLTYLVPVGIMVSFPVRALFGMISPSGVVASFVVGISAIVVSLKLWKFAMTKYSSASS